MKRFSRKFVTVTVVLAGMMGAGVAFAAWTATGTGSGDAKALTAQVVDVTAVAPAACLYPGGPACEVSFTLTNDNPYDITFTSMEPGTITSSDEVACPASNVSAVPQAGLSLASPHNVTTAVLSIADVVSMDHDALDGCQGQTFTVALTLSGSQN